MTAARERDIRVARLLYTIVKEIMPTANSNIVPLARGIALQAQLLKLRPTAFDCANGHDALSAIAHASTRAQLLALAYGNAHTLSHQWAAIVALVDAKLPASHAHTTWGPVREAERVPASTWPPKLFDGWFPRGK